MITTIHDAFIQFKRIKGLIYQIISEKYNTRNPDQINTIFSSKTINLIIPIRALNYSIDYNLSFNKDLVNVSSVMDSLHIESTHITPEIDKLFLQYDSLSNKYECSRVEDYHLDDFIKALNIVTYEFLKESIKDI